MFSSNDPRLLKRGYSAAEAVRSMLSVPDHNDDIPTDVTRLIAALDAQDAEMTAGENEFLDELTQRDSFRR
jgi:hypothetical protein